MKILIVDDEQPARERLQRLLSEIGDHDVVGEAANGKDAVALYNELQPEIVLLDIRMPMMDGLETAQHLVVDPTPPAIIFTTAYDDHALDAFKAHAVAYLLKPIRKEHLSEALSSARRSNRAQLDAVNEQPALDSSPRRHICVRSRGSLELIPVEDVLFFRAEDKYVTMHYRGGQVLIEDSLVKLEQEFSKLFLRVHRNALVAYSEICGLEKQADGSLKIKLTNTDERVDVSRRHLPTVRQFLKHP